MKTKIDKESEIKYLIFKQMVSTFILASAIFILFIISITNAIGQVQFANLEDFQLENNEVIQDCKMGYQTFGQLNEEKSNAILFPSWYGGTSSSLLPYLGAENMLDTTRFFVIIADAFGNGVSSSPSNSASQANSHFPAFSIKDMVHAEYQLVTEHLGLDHLYAVTGISMGGFQTYQWMVSYPDFFDKAAPIVGTPRLTTYEHLFYELWTRLMEMYNKTGDQEISTLVMMLETMKAYTPEYFAQSIPQEDFPVFLKEIEEEAKEYNLYDLLSQLNAIKKQDITADFEGSLEAAAQAFKGDVLIVVAKQDQMVTPFTSREFAELMHTQILELEGNAGHFIFYNNKEMVNKPVNSFLKQNTENQ